MKKDKGSKLTKPVNFVRASVLPALNSVKSWLLFAQPPCRGGRRFTVVVTGPRSPAVSPLSLSLRCVRDGVRRGGLEEEPELAPFRSCVKKKGASAPFAPFPFFFCVLGLKNNSTKTANPISQPPILTQSLNDLLSTIHSQIRQGSILINLETNSKVETLIVFRKRLNKLNNN